jgi:hypothetical protein
MLYGLSFAESGLSLGCKQTPRSYLQIIKRGDSMFAMVTRED